MIAVALSHFSKDSSSNIFFENIEGQIITNISDRIFLTLANMSVQEKQEISVLIPIDEAKIIAYTTIFTLHIANVYYSLSIIVDSVNQNDLFKRIPIIQGLTKDFISQLKIDNLEIKTMHNFPKFQKLIREVIESVNDLFLMDPLGYIIPKNSTFMLLISKLGKNMHEFLNSVLNNKKTVILADPQNDQFLLQYPWSNLIPKRNLKIKFWPNEITNDDDFDILIIDKFQKQECDPHWSIIDLDTGTIENGMHDETLKTYFSYLQELNQGLGHTLKVSKLNPPVLVDNKLLLSNFVLFDEDFQENEIYLVQTKENAKLKEAIV